MGSTGHQAHFLSRLDRVSAPHVELALSLYRDVDLLKYILSHARLPEAAERAAISLDHPTEGPFLVVTRDGKFVTCLGAGMSSGDLPIITRGQLDGIGAKLAVLRERVALCKTLAGERGGLGKLLRRIYEAADEFSREEFLAISALQPIYAPEFFSYLFGAAVDIQEARDVLVRALRKSDKLKPAYRPSLLAYWKQLWAIGHLSVLSAIDGRSVIDSFPGWINQMLHKASPSWGAVRQGVLGLAIKGAWTSGRFGKVLLPGFKSRFPKASSHLTILDAVMGLTLIGMRTSRLKAEVQKTLAGGLDPEDDGSPNAFAELARVTAKIAIDIMDEPEPSLLAHREIGAKLAVLSSKGIRSGPYRFEKTEDVPDDLARTLAVNIQPPFLNKDSPFAFTLLLTYMPWVARAAPEQLYLPADYLKAVHMPWTPEATLKILRSHRDYYGPERDHITEGPARKGPCPCGSGKKYKRCCGADKDDDRAGSSS